MIRAENLGKQFDRPDGEAYWVFRGVSFEVPEGGAVAVIGPSGSGKSVLLKTLAGLEQVSEGQVEIRSSEVSMLFQKNALFDSLTVEENLTFPMKERLGLTGKAAQDRAKFLLDEVGLQGTEKLMPDELSGGMQKRLGIARAISVQPKVILYDEPTAGLDPITSRKIAELIIDLRKETACTVVAVTNDMHRAYQLGDQIFLLAQGRLFDGGSPEQTRTSQNPALRQFVRGLQEGPLT